MLAALCTGTLIRDPQRRESAKGSTYVTALLRVPVNGDDPVLVSVIAFNTTVVEQLLALSRGDAISVTGRAEPDAAVEKGRAVEDYVHGRISLRQCIRLFRQHREWSRA
jgi:hypothetical protein